MGQYLRSPVQGGKPYYRINQMTKFLIDYPRALIKLVLFISIISTYFVCAIIKYFSHIDAVKRRRSLLKNSKFFCSLLVKVYNIKLNVVHPLDEKAKGLIVGNHMGFIDVVCMNAISDCVFITSVEMKKTPFLGQITKLAGCGYVNRKNRMHINKELEEMASIMKQGFRVVLYPESVASDGEQVLPFKKTLIMSARVAGEPIYPYVFNFRKVNNREVRFSDRDSLCWYGDQGFISSLWRSLQLKSIDCEIKFLEPMKVAHDDERDLVAYQLHQRIEAQFIPFKKGMNQEVDGSILVGDTKSEGV